MMSENISCASVSALARLVVRLRLGQRRSAHLQLGCWVRRFGRKQLQHVDETAARPCAHAGVLVLQQAAVGQLLGDGPQRFVVGVLLVHCAQLVQQRLHAREQVAHADLLAWPPRQRLLELQLPHAILLLFLLLLFDFGLLLFDDLYRRCCAAPAAWSHVACFARSLGDYGASVVVSWLCNRRVCLCNCTRRGVAVLRAPRKVEARRGGDDAFTR